MYRCIVKCFFIYQNSFITDTNKRSTKFEPINPALPVTNIVFILQFFNPSILY